MPTIVQTAKLLGIAPSSYFMEGNLGCPIDVEFGLPKNREQESLCEFVKKLKQTLEQAYEIAQGASSDHMLRHKKYFDQKHKCMKIEPGDFVMVRIKAFGRDHKVADKWERTPYRVLSQNGKKPVFMVQSVKETGTRNIKTLHRNMLFPLSSKQYESIQENNFRETSIGQK